MTYNFSYTRKLLIHSSGSIRRPGQACFVCFTLCSIFFNIWGFLVDHWTSLRTTSGFLFFSENIFYTKQDNPGGIWTVVTTKQFSGVPKITLPPCFWRILVMNQDCHTRVSALNRNSSERLRSYKALHWC